MVNDQEFASEVMRQLRKLVINKDQAGEVLVSLLEMAENFRKEGQCQQAIECCKYGLDMTSEDWITGLDISRNYGKGLASAWLATAYLTKGLISTAITYYEDAAKQFRGDTPSKVQEESIIRMILSRIYVRDGQWGKALGAVQHSLNAFNEKSISRRDENTAELVKEVKKQVEDVRKQLREHMSTPPKTSVTNRREEPVYLPIYKDRFHRDCVIGEIGLDKKHAYEADFVFWTNEKNAVNPDIQQGDLVLIRPMPYSNKKEIVLVKFKNVVTAEAEPSFKYLIPRKNHYFLTSPPAHNSIPTITVVVDPHITRQELEPCYVSYKKAKVEYVKSRDLDILGKAVGLVRLMSNEEGSDTEQ